MHNSARYSAQGFSAEISLGRSLRALGSDDLHEVAVDALVEYRTVLGRTQRAFDAMVDGGASEARSLNVRYAALLIELKGKRDFVALAIKQLGYVPPA